MTSGGSIFSTNSALQLLAVSYQLSALSQDRDEQLRKGQTQPLCRFILLQNSLPAGLPPTLAKTAQGWGTPSWNGTDKKG